jgi:hypothetical protein
VDTKATLAAIERAVLAANRDFRFESPASARISRRFGPLASFIPTS